MKKKNSKKNKLTKKERFELILILLCVPVLIIGFAVSLSIYSTKRNGEVPTVMGYSFLTVASNSMEPELMVGESFVCKTAKADKVKAGDIISFKKGGQIITHKVASVHSYEKDGKKHIFFQTYGVNNKKANGEHLMDPYFVEEGQLLGIYAGSSSLNGFIGFLVSSWGMFCFVIVPIGVIILSDILSLISYIQIKEPTETETPQSAAAGSVASIKNILSILSLISGRSETGEIKSGNTDTKELPAETAEAKTTENKPEPL